MDDKEDLLIDNGKGVKAGWSGQDKYYLLLFQLRANYLIARANYDIEQMYWTLRDELGHVKSYIIKCNDELKNVEELLLNAKNLIFGGRGGLQRANRTLAMEELYNAYELLNKLESINKLWQPVGMTTEQKIRRSF